MEQMLENLIYCLNATIPIFLLMLFGLFFRKAGLFDDAFAGKLNRFVFTIGLPVMLFKDLSTQNFFAFWDGSFVLFCFFATLLSIVMVAVARSSSSARCGANSSRAATAAAPPFWAWPSWKIYMEVQRRPR